MTLRLALLLLALLPLAACKQPTPDTAPAVEAAADKAAPTGSPVAGVDYIVIPGGQPYAAGDGKVEVAEAFGYACPHCAHFEPLIKAWKATLPANARFEAVPAPFGGPWDSFARGYYAAEAGGLVEKTHEAMFDAIHGQRTLPPNASIEQISAFYAQHGADAAAFAAAMRSPAIDAKLDQARQFLARTEVPGTADIGTPMLIVNGKYRIDAGEGGYEKMLDTASKLIAQESASGG